MNRRAFDHVINLLLSDLIKSSTAARLLGVSAPTIVELIQTNRLAYVLIDGQRFLFRSDCQRYAIQRSHPNVNKRRAKGHKDFQPKSVAA